MSRLNDPENFRGRVNYAAQVIAYGRRPTRGFDNCFENYDGDEVATVILRRSKKNARLAANLHCYLNMASLEAAADRLADVRPASCPKSPDKGGPARRPSSMLGSEIRCRRDPPDHDVGNADNRRTSEPVR
ncbi:hypothetical protein SAMN02982922_0124 [Mesorhizobium australicum]|uniref:Uncharacterized protein n=1 Tax=Mesorhizobium australicum TaxID=536018 RepID=A0A1X7MQN4_9HYPH|nr:hypothetical protein SAMN02982922_0124 [Mesorhizobium australicum]